MHDSPFILAQSALGDVDQPLLVSDESFSKEKDDE